MAGILGCVSRILFAASLLLLLSVSAVQAADANGYTVQYECRAGNPNCNVDVASFGQRACDQTIEPTTPWTSINWANNTICLAAGDHTGKGTLNVPASASGTAGNYKVLRYFRSGDTDDDPWNQSSANQAKISRIKFLGARFWVVHRLVFDPNFAAHSSAIHVADGVTRSDHIVINRVLAQHGERQVYFEGALDSVIQNSVLRESIKATGVDSDGVRLGHLPRNIWIVNNEIYRIHSHGVSTSANSDSPGSVIKNNDVYVDASVQYTNCEGSYTTDPNAPCSDAEAGISLKSGGGSSAGHLKIIHNRIWGQRRTDTNVCCISGGQGNGMTLSSQDVTDPGTHYALLQNNIVTHMQTAVVTPREGPQNNSIIGNIFYNIKDYYAPVGSIGSWALSSLGHWDSNEVYLNTVVDSNSWGNFGSGNSDLDVKCNAIIASGPNTGGTPDAGTVVDDNAFIGTTKFTANGVDNNIAKTIATRSNATSYSLGSIVRFSSIGACNTGAESACFLYKAIVAGTSAASTPSACTDLGCQFADGGVTWQAGARAACFFPQAKNGA